MEVQTHKTICNIITFDLTLILINMLIIKYINIYYIGILVPNTVHT